MICSRCGFCFGLRYLTSLSLSRLMYTIIAYCTRTQANNLNWNFIFDEQQTKTDIFSKNMSKRMMEKSERSEQQQQRMLAATMASLEHFMWYFSMENSALFWKAISITLQVIFRFIPFDMHTCVCTTNSMHAARRLSYSNFILDIKISILNNRKRL